MRWSDKVPGALVYHKGDNVIGIILDRTVDGALRRKIRVLVREHDGRFTTHWEFSDIWKSIENKSKNK